jgi:hypothetical protein
MIRPELRGALLAAGATAKRLGVPLPAALTVDLARGAPFTVTAVTPAEWAQAITGAKGPPETDPVVAALVTRQSLVNLRVGEHIAGHVEAQPAMVLAVHVPAIIESWRVALQPDARTLADTFTVLGVATTLDNPPARAKPAVFEAWARARDAAERFDIAAGAWWILAGVSRIGRNPHRRAMVLASPTITQYETLTSRPTAWEIVCAGCELELATFEQWAQRNSIFDDAVGATASAVAQRQLARSKKMPGGRFDPSRVG